MLCSSSARAPLGWRERVQASRRVYPAGTSPGARYPNPKGALGACGSPRGRARRRSRDLVSCYLRPCVSAQELHGTKAVAMALGGIVLDDPDARSVTAGGVLQHARVLGAALRKLIGHGSQFRVLAAECQGAAADGEQTWHQVVRLVQGKFEIPPHGGRRGTVRRTRRWRRLRGV
jgi:hypothetical protein